MVEMKIAMTKLLSKFCIEANEKTKMDQLAPDSQSGMSSPKPPPAFHS